MDLMVGLPRSRLAGDSLRQNLMQRLKFYIAILLLFPVAGRGSTTKNVLILHEGSRLLPYLAIISRQLQEDIGADESLKTEIFEEYLDNWRLSADISRSSAMLEAKYTGRRFDVVVADGGGALSLLIDHPPPFLRGTPVVLVSLPDYLLPSPLPRNITGVATHVDYARTVQLAMALQPDLQHVYYIDSEPLTVAVKNQMFHPEFQGLNGRVEMSFWVQEDLESLLKKVSNLPPHSAVLFDSYFEDPRGQTYIPAQVCAQVAARANAPVYAPYQTMLGIGPVGGVIVDFEALGRQAARIILGLLHGAAVADFPIERSQNHMAIDWRQLQKFHLSEDRVPREAVIYFREPTLWTRYRWYLVSGSLVILLQTLLIVKLAIEGKRRKQSEKSTRELAGRLIHAQEEERRRIAAELHDDVCQRLALVCLQLDTIRATPPKSQEVLVNELSVLYDEADMISSDIHQFSRELHPSILERLGLLAALRRFCAEFTAHRKIAVNFSSSGDEAVLDQEVALVLFRVGQECLMNISKHSGAQSCDVLLRFGRDRMVLEVRDTGNGFEPNELRGSTGLGLESMRERLRSVSGKLRVDSAPHRGTRVHAEVPLNLTAQAVLPT
jgi:signal transduction histidine kinase